MAITATLSAVPGHKECCDGMISTIVQITKTIGSGKCEIRSLADAREAVQSFGRSIREANPDLSFVVLIHVHPGGRKPSGYDDAHRRREFGEEDYMAVREKNAAA